MTVVAFSRALYARLVAGCGLLMLAALPAITHAQAGESACGPVVKPGHYGPYDYVTDRNRLEIVERFHFTPNVEALLRGQSDYIGGDISYTLDAFPNHHRALLALIKWNARLKTPQPPYLRLSIECYFDRALRFRPKDTVVRVLLAMFLAQNQRKDEAIQQLNAAVFHAGENPLSHYNIGLTYFDLGEFEAALRQAHLAQKLGFPGTVLIDRLKSAGHWKEPAE